MNENIPVNVFVAQPTATTYTFQPPTTSHTSGSTEEPDTVTSAEAAVALGVTMNNLRQMVFKKKLTPVGKAGRKNLFARDQVNALAASRGSQ